MDGLTLLWQTGQSLSLIALGIGGYITVPKITEILGYYRSRPSESCPHKELHDPLNHRLLCEPEW